MAAAEDPAKVFSKLVSGVDDTRWVAHDNVASLAPLLHGEVLDVNVAGTFGRTGEALIMLMAA